MHAETKTWIDKAEGDFIGATLLARKRSNKVAHLTCFAAQQCAEKYLKAFLVEHNVSFSKTHDLTKELLPRCVKIDKEFSILFSLLEILDPYAVQFRYPGDKVTHQETKDALRSAQAVRKYVRQKLSLGKSPRLL